MPTWDHSTIQTYLAALLLSYLTQTGLGRVLAEFRCIFGPPGRVRVFVPDLVYIAKSKLPVNTYLYEAPDLAIEVLSPDQHMTRFMGKIQFYLRHGVRMVWVIDPRAQTVAVFAPDAEEQLLGPGATLDGGEVLPGLSVPVADIFAQMEP
jgi:Uma2 family endonuclease